MHYCGKQMHWCLESWHACPELRHACRCWRILLTTGTSTCPPWSTGRNGHHGPRLDVCAAPPVNWMHIPPGGTLDPTHAAAVRAVLRLLSVLARVRTMQSRRVGRD